MNNSVSLMNGDFRSLNVYNSLASQALMIIAIDQWKNKINQNVNYE